MNGKQKRAFNAAQRAIQHLSEVVADDPQGFNAIIGMLTGAAGIMIGSMSAAQSQTSDDMHQATVRAAQHLQTEAARGYAAYTLAEKSMAGSGH